MLVLLAHIDTEECKRRHIMLRFAGRVLMHVVSCSTAALLYARILVYRNHRIDFLFCRDHTSRNRGLPWQRHRHHSRSTELYDNSDS